MTLTPEKPPIAEHPIWERLRSQFNTISRTSLNQNKFPLLPLTDDDLRRGLLDVQISCICDDLFPPYRHGLIYFTAHGHRSCAASQRTRNWALWLGLEIGKIHADHVQYGLYD